MESEAKNTDPDRVLGSGSKGLNFLLRAGIYTYGCRRTWSREDEVAVQVLADIDVALHDGVVGGGVDTNSNTTN